MARLKQTDEKGKRLPEGLRRRMVLRGHTDKVTELAVTPDGRRAVSASLDNSLKVWDLETGSEERTLSGHSEEVYSVALTPDGRRVVSASSDKSLKV